MLLSTPSKIGHATVILSLFFVGCGLWNRNETPTSTAVAPPRSEVPFATREPDVYRAEMVIRSGDLERRILIARDGGRRRIDYDVGRDDHRAVLSTDRQYVLFFKRKTYMENSAGPANSPSMDLQLAGHLLNGRDYTDFEELGREGSIVRYRARVNESDASEIMIWVDEAIGLPVKQEFYSLNAGQQTLRYSVELRDFSPTVDPSVFQLPAGFRQEARPNEQP